MIWWFDLDLEKICNYQRLLEQSFDGIIVHMDGRIIYANRSAASIVGLDDPNAFIGMNIYDFVHDDSLKTVRQRVRKMYEESVAMPMIEEKFVRSDGIPVDVEVSAASVNAKGKNLVQVVFRDISERKAVEAELNEARAKAELYLDLMGHDINNMNQIAMGYLEFAIDIINAGGSINKENLELITKPVETLASNSRLISNVGKVRREKTGAYQPEVIEIEKMLTGVIDGFMGITSREVSISLTADSACRVRANELLKDVFVNLVGNAIKHSDRAKPLTIDITSGPVDKDGKKFCRIAVEDNGPGIPDSLKKQLFDRMSLDLARKTGKGFGLCLTDMLVKDYSGRLLVENRVAGDYTQGTRFVVLLPGFTEK